MRLLLGTTKLTPCSIMKRPTMRVWARSKTSTTAPSRRPRRSMPSAQAAAQGLEVFLGGEAEGRGDLFERFGPALLGQVFQDEFAAGDGLVVFLRLALVKGVFGRTAFRHDIFLILKF